MIHTNNGILDIVTGRYNTSPCVNTNDYDPNGPDPIDEIKNLTHEYHDLLLVLSKAMAPLKKTYILNIYGGKSSGKKCFFDEIKKIYQDTFVHFAEMEYKENINIVLFYNKETTADDIIRLFDQNLIIINITNGPYLGGVDDYYEDNDYEDIYHIEFDKYFTSYPFDINYRERKLIENKRYPNLFKTLLRYHKLDTKQF